jgi:hypothetical protein
LSGYKEGLAWAKDRCQDTKKAWHGQIISVK